jgi:hypothetical protein
LVQYDKKTYDREVNENKDTEGLVSADIDEMDAEDKADADAEEDDEAMDISGLGEDYRDGDYYGEDDDE